MVIVENLKELELALEGHSIQVLLWIVKAVLSSFILYEVHPVSVHRLHYLSVVERDGHSDTVFRGAK